jgi:hypothetical protein
MGRIIRCLFLIRSVCYHFDITLSMLITALLSDRLFKIVRKMEETLLCCVFAGMTSVPSLITLTVTTQKYRQENTMYVRTQTADLGSPEPLKRFPLAVLFEVCSIISIEEEF